MDREHFEELMKHFPIVELQQMLEEKIDLCFNIEAVFRPTLDDIIQLQMEIEVLALAVTERRINRRNNIPWQQPEYPPICFNESIKKRKRNTAKDCSKSQLAKRKRTEFEILLDQILLAKQALKKRRKYLTTQEKDTLESLCIIGKAISIEAMPELEPEPKPNKKKKKQKKPKKSARSRKSKLSKKNKNKQDQTEKALKVTEEAKKTAAEGAKESRFW